MRRTRASPSLRSSARPGQQGPPGRGERGHERLEQLLERGSAVGLTGHEGAVNTGWREARELVSGRALWVVAERERYLRPRELERVLSYAADDGLYLPAAALATGVGLEMPALAAPVGALAAAVRMSRVTNGAHYPSDIAGG